MSAGELPPADDQVTLPMTLLNWSRTVSVAVPVAPGSGAVSTMIPSAPMPEMPIVALVSSRLNLRSSVCDDPAANAPALYPDQSSPKGKVRNGGTPVTAGPFTVMNGCVEPTSVSVAEMFVNEKSPSETFKKVLVVIVIVSP